MLLVISLLKKERQIYIEKLQNSSSHREKNIKMKSQLDDAIKNLEFCDTYGISAQNIELIKLDEKGSEGFFSEYYIIDENDLKNTPKLAIKKDTNGEEIVLTCFDIVIKRK
jgi:hypothetical protein